MSDSEWYVANFVVETDGGDGGFFRLGTRSVERTAFTSSLAQTSSAASRIDIGGVSTSGRFVPNSIGEVLIYNEKLGDLDRAYVSAHLRDKWNVTLGSEWTFDAKITPSDGSGSSSDYFGTSVAVSGRVVVVGAPNDDRSTTDDGSVYVFDSSSSSRNWTQTQRLNPPQSSDSTWVSAYYGYFGRSVAISGETIVVGAPRVNSETYWSYSVGAAYVYERGSDGTWTQRAALERLNTYAKDYFGDAVAMSGDVIVVGAQ